MNYPLLKNFKVDAEITNFLIKKYEEYRRTNNMSWQENTAFSNQDKNSGYQTPNMLDWDNNEFQSFLKDKFFAFVSNELGSNNLSYFWAHYLEYEGGGSMDIHKHCHNEDFVLFVYLSTCQTGNTIFYLNDFNVEYMQRICVKVRPIKNTGTCFSSLLAHEGEFTEENKKIFVVGLRLNNNKTC